MTINQQHRAHAEDSAREAGVRLFVTTSLVFLLLACLMLAGRSSFLTATALTGHGLSWLLLLLLGSALNGVFGVVYWAVPRVFGVSLYSGKFVILHYGFHMAGTLLALASLVWPAFSRGAMGMIFIACGALVFAVNILGSFQRPSKPDVAGAYMMASAVWLLIAAFLGLPFAQEAPIAILAGTNWSAAWLVLALAGVVLNLPMGIALRVTPKVLGSTVEKTDRAWYALAISNAGLAWMFPATAFGPMPFLLGCAAVYLAGILLYFGEFVALLRRRAAPVLEWDCKILFAAFSLAPISAIFLMMAAWQHIPPPPAPEIPGAIPAAVEEQATGPLPVEFLPIDAATILTALLAVAIPAIVALVFQLVRIDAGDATAPARQRLAGQILLASFFNYATGILLLIPGAWAGIERLTGLGSLFLLVGAAGFLGNYFFGVSRGEGAVTSRLQGHGMSADTVLS